MRYAGSRLSVRQTVLYQKRASGTNFALKDLVAADCDNEELKVWDEAGA